MICVWIPKNWSGLPYNPLMLLLSHRLPLHNLSVCCLSHFKINNKRRWKEKAEKYKDKVEHNKQLEENNMRWTCECMNEASHRCMFTHRKQFNHSLFLIRDDVFITMRDAVIKLIYDEKTRDKVAGLLLSHFLSHPPSTVRSNSPPLLFLILSSECASEMIMMIINNLNCFQLVHINQ